MKRLLPAIFFFGIGACLSAFSLPLYQSACANGYQRLYPRTGGPHVIFELRGKPADIDTLLPDKLTAFARSGSDWKTLLKKHVLFNPTMVKWVRGRLADPKKWSSMGDLDGGQIRDALQTGVKYNYVICGDKIFIGSIFGKNPKWDNWLSKHVLIAGYDKDVRYAGEFWKDDVGTIHFSNNSGTYRPDAKFLPNVEAVLRKHVFTDPKIVLESHDANPD